VDECKSLPLAFIRGNEVGEKAHNDREADGDEHVAEIVHGVAAQVEIESKF